MDIVEILGRIMGSLVVVAIVWHLLDKPRLKAVDASGDAAAADQARALTRLFYMAFVGSLAAKVAAKVLAGSAAGPLLALAQAAEVALFAGAAFFEFKLVRATTPALLGAKAFPASLKYFATAGKWKSALSLAGASIDAGLAFVALLAPTLLSAAAGAQSGGLGVFVGGLSSALWVVAGCFGAAYWIAVARAAKAMK